MTQICSERRDMMLRKSGLVMVLVFFVCGVILVSGALAQDFQKSPIILRAPEVLPRELLSCRNYTIKETVKSDGLINIYEVDPPYGTLKVATTALLLRSEEHTSELQSRLHLV